MRGQNTKERILDAALELFASQGYEQVTMEEIAHAVDIKAPSLYKHFSGKQEIYDSIVKKSEQVFYSFSLSLGISEDQVETMHGMLQLEPEAMKSIGMMLFEFLLHDPFTVRFRRMLSMRQYSDPTLAEIYTRFYIVQPMEYQGAVADAMKGAAGANNPDAELLGLEFYAPIFLLINRCDIDPTYEQAARRLLVKHMDHVIQGRTDKDDKGEAR